MIAVFLIFEAVERFSHPVSIDGNLMLIVAGVGLLGNLLSVFLLEEQSHENINVKAGYLHLLGDTLS